MGFFDKFDRKLTFLGDFEKKTLKDYEQKLNATRSF